MKKLLFVFILSASLFAPSGYGVQAQVATGFRISNVEVKAAMQQDGTLVEGQRDLYATFSSPATNVRVKTYSLSSGGLVSDYTYPFSQVGQTSYALSAQQLSPASIYYYIITADEFANPSNHQSWKGTFSTTGFNKTTAGPSLVFTSSAVAIKQGQTINLSWWSEGATSCRQASDYKNANGVWQAQPDDHWASFVEGGLNGEVYSVPPTLDTRYTVTCFNSQQQSVSRSIEVAVEQPAPPPVPDFAVKSVKAYPTVDNVTFDTEFTGLVDVITEQIYSIDPTNDARTLFSSENYPTSPLAPVSHIALGQLNKKLLPLTRYYYLINATKLGSNGSVSTHSDGYFTTNTQSYDFLLKSAVPHPTSDNVTFDVDFKGLASKIVEKIYTFDPSTRVTTQVTEESYDLSPAVSHVSLGWLNKSLTPGTKYSYLISGDKEGSNGSYGSHADGEFTTLGTASTPPPATSPEPTREKQTLPIQEPVKSTRELNPNTQVVTPATQSDEVLQKAGRLQNDKLDALLAEISQLRDKVKEQENEVKYLRKLTQDNQNISAAVQDTLTNFITYGADANTQKLGAGERAAVVSSYKSAFNKLPDSNTELADMINIANGKYPTERSLEIEKKSQKDFLKIYKRIPNLKNSNDLAAIMVMSYGLRQIPVNRNLVSEATGIRTFKAIYGHNPQTTTEWNIMQAITYSGAKRKADTDKDLIADEDEAAFGTDPNNRDTDGDGFIDGLEVLNGYDPLVK